ncbi:MAG: phosphohistidine phosphatase SixA [Cyanobacteria bacterium P01_A01_bin.135]
MITLYLIRHGIAAERGTYANDGERPLTAKGRQRTRRVAERLAQTIQVELILTSPLVRAQQTAEILGEAGLGEVAVSEHLAPDGDFHQWLGWLAGWRGEALAMVGHEPNLSEWAERLLWGQCRGCLAVKKAGVLGLHLPNNSPEGNSALFWLAPPRLLL